MAQESQSITLHKVTLVSLVAAPGALFLPWATGAPTDAGLLVVLGLLLLWRPGGVWRAARSGTFQLLSAFAAASLFASGRVDAANIVYATKFIVGVLTGIALHFVYVQDVQSGFVPSRPERLLVALWVALISAISLISDTGHTQFAVVSLTLASLILFSLLSTIARLVFLAIATAVFIVLNSKVLLVALLLGCLVLGNLRRRSTGVTFRLGRAALVAALLMPALLAVLWYFRPDRVEDLIDPTDSISTMARLDFANAGVAAFLDNPFLGLGGYGMNIDYNFLRYYDERNLAPLIARGLTRSHAEVYGAGYTSGVHNMYLDYLSTYGGISFIVMLMLVVRGLTVAFREGYLVKIAAALTILVLGLAWQYTSTALGTAVLMFTCWPFRFRIQRDSTARAQVSLGPASLQAVR